MRRMYDGTKLRPFVATQNESSVVIARARSGDTDRVPGRWEQLSEGTRVPAESGGSISPFACRVPDNTERSG
jgi:hypothetical protein